MPLDLDDPEALSLALIDSRNHLLRWLAAWESAPDAREVLRLAGHVARLQERSLAGAASIEPNAERWWGDAEAAVAPDLPGFDATRRFMIETLEASLERLAAAPHDAGAALRAALAHEDALLERLAELAQAGELPAAAQRALWPPLPVRAPRAPLGFAGLRDLPDFEIDAQAVSWAEFAEFVHDGGYDAPDAWSSEGWQWVQREARRCPRYVEQLREGVLLQRAGALQRVAPAQAAVHLSWHEADAWCRWAGRRLPAELEWDHAARVAGSRGFVCGDVWEWVAGRAEVPGLRVQRGGSWMTARRLGGPALRRLAAADHDAGFSGFRSCAR